MTNPFFWPGTKIVKSLNNDFNWMGGESYVLKELKAHINKSTSGKLGAMVSRGEAYYIPPAEKPFQQIMSAFSKAKSK